MIALLVGLLAAGPSPLASCPALDPGPGLGVADPFRPPDPKATELNTAAKVLYRAGKWEEARAQYRAAMAADPEFLAPRLNVACSFVRQERFTEATAEVRGLLQTAYVPWAREVLEAADLGALKVQPQMAEIRQLLAEGAAAWGAGLDSAVLFVGRHHEPLRIPDGPGAFLLNPRQEAFAFIPASGRFRQLTAEDGHVVAIARSGDGRRLVYATAKQWVRGPAPKDVALRGVALHELTLATMTSGTRITLEGDIRRLEMLATPRGIAYRIERSPGRPRDAGTFLRGDAGTLAPYPGVLPRNAGRLAVLTGAGAALTAPITMGGPCPLVARDDARGARTVVISGRGRPLREKVIGSRFGAGLAGLPLP
jgi:hypothetical protein